MWIKRSSMTLRCISRSTNDETSGEDELEEQNSKSSAPGYSFEVSIPREALPCSAPSSRAAALPHFDVPQCCLRPHHPRFGVAERERKKSRPRRDRAFLDGKGDAWRCTLEESQADRGLEVPAWMFDRTACPDPGRLAAQPYVSIEALAALSALLDLALKDQTPSAVLLSGASRASHHQNRGAVHVTCDDKLRERMPTQSTIALAASDGSVRERPLERRHRRARTARAAGGSAGGATGLMTQLILDHVATTATLRAKEVDHDL
jgi:hypothetical protein